MSTAAAMPQTHSQEVTLLLAGQPAGTRHLPLQAAITVGPAPEDTFSIPHLDASVGVIAHHDGARVLCMDSVRDGGTLTRSGAGQADLGTLWRPDGRLPLLDTDTL